MKVSKFNLHRIAAVSGRHENNSVKKAWNKPRKIVLGRVLSTQTEIRSGSGSG